ncbi:MAG: methyltransferase domain-containing protein [Candidatus Taylorbacteria bacterium]
MKNISQNEKVQMSKQFRSRIFSCKDFKERMSYIGEHLQEMESVSATNRASLGFNQKVFKLVDMNLSKKKVLLFGASFDEVKAFCALAENVYFITIPFLDDVVLPQNAHQMEYDEEFSIKNPDKILFDFIFSNHVVEHIFSDDLHRHLKEMYDLLRVGGEYFIICPSKHSIVTAPIEFFNYHIGQYTYAQIASLALEIGFCSYRPIINPYLFNHFIEYKRYQLENILSKLPVIFLSILGLNSLYIKLKK